MCSRESGFVTLDSMGVMKRINELKVSRQIRKIDNELKVFREVRNIDDEYEFLVTSAKQKSVFVLEIANAPKAMSFIAAVFFSYKNYSNFKGRASRSEFWYWVLFVALAIFGLAVVAPFAGLNRMYADLLVAIFGVSSIVPSVARVVRRLHDTNKPGTYALFWFTPIVGYVLLTVWFCTKSDRAGNRFGPSEGGNHESRTLHRTSQRSVNPVSGQRAPQSGSSRSFLRKFLRKILS